MSKTEEVKHKQAQETLRKCEHFEPEKDPSIIHPSIQDPTTIKLN